MSWRARIGTAYSAKAPPTFAQFAAGNYARITGRRGGTLNEREKARFLNRQMTEYTRRFGKPGL